MFVIYNNDITSGFVASETQWVEVFFALWYAFGVLLLLNIVTAVFVTMCTGYMNGLAEKQLLDQSQARIRGRNNKKSITEDDLVMAVPVDRGKPSILENNNDDDAIENMTNTFNGISLVRPVSADQSAYNNNKHPHITSVPSSEHSVPYPNQHNIHNHISHNNNNNNNPYYQNNPFYLSNPLNQRYMKDVIFQRKASPTPTTSPENNNNNSSSNILTDRNTFTSMRNSFKYMKKLFELDEDHQLIDLDLYDIEPVVDVSNHRPSYSMRSVNNGIMDILDPNNPNNNDEFLHSQYNRESQSVSLRFDQSIFASTQDRAKLHTWVISSVPLTYQQSLKHAAFDHTNIEEGRSVHYEKGLFYIVSYIYNIYYYNDNILVICVL